MVAYRLGLDIGTNSIGWCAVKLNADGHPVGVLGAGVRILTPNDEAGRDPKSKASLAATRRVARGMRRRRDRFLRRQERLMHTLIAAGLMPADRDERKKLEELDPYWLRKAALDERIGLHELGRALFHLNQRRGFKSNRVADAGNDEAGTIKLATKALEARIKQGGARTLGELLAGWHGRDKHGRRSGDDHAGPRPVRFRPTSRGGKNLYDFYPTREIIEKEIDRIWEQQKGYHIEFLTPQLLKKIKRIVVEQRPLKKPIVGRCTLAPGAEITRPYGFVIDLGERAPKAHPLFQRFRILQDVCQLRVRRPGRPERFLTVQERDAIAAVLMERSGTSVAFEAIRKAIKLPDDARFNHELAGRKGLPTNQTARKLASKKTFGRFWRGFPTGTQAEIVEHLLAVQDEDALCDWLRSELGVDEETAKSVSETRLPQGHCRFGRAVLRGLVEVMEQKACDTVDSETGEISPRPLTYDEAVRHLGLHHSDLRPEEMSARLPYYGEVLARHVISQPAAPEGSVLVQAI